MNPFPSSDRCRARRRRVSSWALVQAVLALAVVTSQEAHAQKAQAAVICEEFKYGRERLNYNDPADRPRIRQIEGNHFEQDWEMLGRGVTSSTAGADIDFVVRASPNHHRALTALVRLSLRDKTPRPAGVKIPVECYLLRALEFAPNDVEVQKIYGTYLARLGRDDEALTWFERAEKLSPDDPVLAYNIGLILTDKRDFERARKYAQKAYTGGVQLPGLREKLSRQGQWQ